MRKTSKLTFKRETVRLLNDLELGRVAGGITQSTAGWNCSVSSVSESGMGATCCCATQRPSVCDC